MTAIRLWIYYPLPDEWYKEYWPEPEDEGHTWDGTLPMKTDEEVGDG